MGMGNSVGCGLAAISGSPSALKSELFLHNSLVNIFFYYQTFGKYMNF